MGQVRKPFQGVGNIVRFNWHFYLLSVGLTLCLQLLNHSLDVAYHFYTNALCLLIMATTIISLLVSFYIYDLSDLYKLNWVEELAIDNDKIVNINAGFDETSILLIDKFPASVLIVLDFYDPLKHTEVSIQRARKAYPPFPGTQRIHTSCFPLPDNYADKIFVTLSAHEIRNENERNTFFKELKRSLKPTGQIIITEHLRDLPNFLAYNIGFFHFISKPLWYKAFTYADLKVSKEIKITPFITTFTLEKYGVTA